MSGFSDLIATAQPRLIDAVAAATEGRTWTFEFYDVNDGAGDPIDLTTATGECKVIADVPEDPADADVIVTLTFAGGLGEFTVTAAPAATADTATDATATTPRKAYWFLTITLGSDSVQVWGPVGSPFEIYPE